MSISKTTLIFPDTAHMAALRDHLREQLAQGVADPVLSQAFQSTLVGLEKGLNEAASNTVVASQKEQWKANQAKLKKQANGWVRDLKKSDPMSFAFQGILEVNPPLQKAWVAMCSNRARLWDEDSFKPSLRLADAKAWDVDVEASLGHQRALIQTIETARLKLKDWPASSGELPDEKRFVALKDCASRALNLLAYVGDAGPDMDMASVEEATLFAAYGRAFQANDFAAVAKLFRAARRDRDPLLEQFTPAMVETAERFCEQESLEWQSQRATKANKGPR